MMASTPQEMGDVALRAGEEVVGANDIDPVRDQAFAKMRAQEPRPTGDENLFRLCAHFKSR